VLVKISIKVKELIGHMNMKWKMFIAVSGIGMLQKNNYDDRHPSIPPKKTK